MKTLACIAVAAAALALANPTTAQETVLSRPSIVVVGEGRAEQMPDAFGISASLEGRGATQADALRALAGIQERVMGGLRRLDGLSEQRLTTGGLNVEPVFAADCATDRYNRDAGNCPVTGYLASLPIAMEGAPIGRAGDAVSLAAELGAGEAKIEAYALLDTRALQIEANRLAFVDARRQAEALADASGQRIVRILRVQDPNASRLDEDITGNISEVVVTGSRIGAGIPIDVAPPPVAVDARVTVVFEIE